MLNKELALYSEALAFYQAVWTAVAYQVEWQGQNQLWRAVTSIVANVVEGGGRARVGGYGRYAIVIALGELHEAMFWLEAACYEQQLSKDSFGTLIAQGEELGESLYALIQSLPEPPKTRAERDEEMEQMRADILAKEES